MILNLIFKDQNALSFLKSWTFLAFMVSEPLFFSYFMHWTREGFEGNSLALLIELD